MTATTIILLICAVLVTFGFILLVAFLLPVLLKFRDLLVEVQSTTHEIRHLAVSLQNTNERVSEDLERVDELLAASRHTVATVNSVVQTVSRALTRHSAGLFALLPAIKIGWSLVKRIKGGR